MTFCREDVRTANIVASDPTGVDCLVIDREYVEFYSLNLMKYFKIVLS